MVRPLEVSALKALLIIGSDLRIPPILFPFFNIIVSLHDLASY